jgi:hypothetical protein
VSPDVSLSMAKAAGAEIGVEIYQAGKYIKIMQNCGLIPPIDTPDAGSH